MSLAVPANSRSEPAEAARFAKRIDPLYDTLESHIANGESNSRLEVQLNVTGGYKAETAIVYGLAWRSGFQCITCMKPTRLPSPCGLRGAILKWTRTAFRQTHAEILRASSSATARRKRKTLNSKAESSCSRDRNVAGRIDVNRLGMGEPSGTDSPADHS